MIEESDVIELKGNQLGWILKLAETHYMNKSFRAWVKKNNLRVLDRFLKLLMCKFHPNNFNAGDSETTWLLVRMPKEEK